MVGIAVLAKQGDTESYRHIAARSFEDPALYLFLVTVSDGQDLSS